LIAVSSTGAGGAGGVAGAAVIASDGFSFAMHIPSNQIRNPNVEIRNKFETRNPKLETRGDRVFVWVISCLGIVSDFGIRISSFEARTIATLGHLYSAVNLNPAAATSVHKEEAGRARLGCGSIVSMADVQ
jgi:hypothetical protein